MKLLIRAPGADGLLWGPYLMGERTPHCDPEVRAALVGIAAHDTRAHVLIAVMEGVAFSLRYSLTIFEELGVPVTKIRLGGGGARSALWRQIQADIFGRPVETVQAEEGPALGAALLAGVGAGVWPSVDEACDSVQTAERVQFRAEIAELYPALHSLSGFAHEFSNA